MYGMGCSKNNDAPTFSKYDALNAPSSLVATYNVDTDMVDVTWTMDDVDSVVDYFIGVSDSVVFDDGNIVEFFTEMPQNNIQNTPYNQSYAISKLVPSADSEQDSVVLYLKVSAVFNNDQFKNFIGPVSNIDSTLVRQNSTN